MNPDTGHPPAIKVGFDWSQTARRVNFLMKNRNEHISSVMLENMLVFCWVIILEKANALSGRLVKGRGSLFCIG